MKKIESFMSSKGLVSLYLVRPPFNDTFVLAKLPTGELRRFVNIKLAKKYYLAK